MMRIYATRNNREDFSGSMCLNVEVGMLTEKLPALTTTCKIYEGTGFNDLANQGKLSELILSCNRELLKDFVQ